MVTSFISFFYFTDYKSKITFYFIGRKRNDLKMIMVLQYCIRFFHISVHPIILIPVFRWCKYFCKFY